MNMVRIPSTTFLMGDERGLENERPVHRVTLGAFDIADCTVTCAEYDAFLIATSRERQPPVAGDLPVVEVSWFDAVAYCGWLSARSDRPFRLPTEAEWECAARGGVESRLYPWGDAPQSRPDHALRWKDGPEPARSGMANGFGLYGMCQNVHEWCSDWFDAAYYARSPERNPRGPVAGTRRASRGGSWRHRIKVSRCSARSSLPPAFRYADYGFRVACGA